MRKLNWDEYNALCEEEDLCPFNYESVASIEFDINHFLLLMINSLDIAMLVLTEMVKKN